MKKFTGKSAAIAAAALLFAQSIPMVGINAAYGNGDNKLTIHSYIVSADQYNAAKTNGANPSGTTSDEIKVPGDATKNAGVTYKIYKLGTDNKPDMTSAYATNATNSEGVVVFDKIETGNYWVDPVIETTSPDFSNADGFYISLTGGNEIDVYPKYTNNGYDNANPENSAAGHTIEFTKEGKSDDNNVTLKGVNYKVYFKNTADKWEAAKNASGTEQIFTTDDNGKITLPGLPLGDYYFVEQDSDDTEDNKITIGDVDYLVDQTPQKVEIAPNASSIAKKTVVNDRTLTVTKRIADDAAGDKFNWIIEADVPSNASNLLSYNIYDNYNDSLSGVTVTKVTTGEGTDNVLSSGAYVSNDDSTAKKITVTIKDFSKLTDKSKVYVYVESVAGTGENLTKLTNDTSIDYKYAYINPGDDSDGDGYCDGTTPAVPLIPDIDTPEGDYPADISVAPPNEGDNPSAEVTLCKFTISNVESTEDGAEELAGAKYQIKSAEGTTYTGSVLTDATDNKMVTVENLAPGKYQVSQTAVGATTHVKATEPITFWVGDDGKIYKDSNGTKGEAYDENKIVFINSKNNNNFALPFTGTTATRVFTICGICVMLAAGIFIFIILKKKDEDEEENKG